MCWTSFSMSFFPPLFIPCVGCKMPSPGEIYGSRRYILIREHHWIVFSSQIFRLGSFSINFFYFPHLFINILSFKNPKNHFSTIDQGFLIFARSLEALVWFISSQHTSSSFHRSFPLSKSKNTQKNLLISIFWPSSLWIQLATTLFQKSDFEELSINLFDT